MEDETVTISKHEVVLDRMFAEDTWELAFGDGAWTNQYTDEDVFQKLREYETKAFCWDTFYEWLDPATRSEGLSWSPEEVRTKMATLLKERTRGWT